MSILILTLESPFKPFGGLGEAIRNLCYNLPDINFLICGEGIQKINKNIEYYNILDTINIPLTDVKSLIPNQKEKILNIIKEKNIKLIHVLDAMFIPLAVKLCEIINIQWIFTFHLSGLSQIEHICDFYKYINPMASNIIMNNNKKDIIQMKKYEDIIFEKAGDIIFVSKYYKNLYNKYPEKDSNRRHVIYNGIDVEEYNKKIALNMFEIPGDNKKIKVLYIGRLCYMKNTEFLLETEIPNGIELIIAGGDKGSSKYFIDKLKNIKYKNIHYVGFLTGDKKKYFIQNVDAIIMPSIHEPFGIVALEAMISKTLFICSRSSGMGEFVSNNSCIYCGVIPYTINKAYKRLLNMTIKEKNGIIENAYNSIKDLTWKSSAEKYSKIYNKYLK